MSSETPLPHDPYPTEGVCGPHPHPQHHYHNNNNNAQYRLSHHQPAPVMGRPIPLVQTGGLGMSRHHAPLYTLQTSNQPPQQPPTAQIISRTVVNPNGMVYSVYNSVGGSGGHHRSNLPPLSSLVTRSPMQPPQPMTHQPMPGALPLMYQQPGQVMAPVAAVQQPTVVYQQIPAAGPVRRTVQTVFGIPAPASVIPPHPTPTAIVPTIPSAAPAARWAPPNTVVAMPYPPQRAATTALWPGLPVQAPTAPLSTPTATLLPIHQRPPPLPAKQMSFPFPPPAPPQPQLALALPPPVVPSTAPTQQQPTVDVWNSAVSGWEQATLIKNKIGLRVGPHGRWQIVQSIASGSYGAIFVAEDLLTRGPTRERVAVKFDEACRDDHLKYEYEVYKSVLYDDGTPDTGVGFPRVHWYGHEFGHNILVMELLGAPVASLFAFCDRKFGRRTIYSIGEQMIKRIRHLHLRGFIHRDVKPENFLAGLGAERESTCYLIDFGLARRYRFRDGESEDGRQLKHIPFRKFRSFVGTAKYASLNSHKGYELSRRDDMESLGYVLVELINGSLPWKHISKKNQPTRHHASQKIKAMKEQTNWVEVCPQVAGFIRYCRELPFAAEPDYEHLVEMLRQALLVDSEEDGGLGEIDGGRVALAVAGDEERKLGEGVKCEECARREREAVEKEKEAAPLVALVPTAPIPSPYTSQAQPLLPSQQYKASLPAPVPLIQHHLPSTLEPTLPTNPIPLSSTAESEEGSTESTSACASCRERQMRLCYDQSRLYNPVDEPFNTLQPHQENILSNGGEVEINGTEEEKMSWQTWRDSTQERRFQYENRFSWTVAHKPSINLSTVSVHHQPSAASNKAHIQPVQAGKVHQNLLVHGSGATGPPMTGPNNHPHHQYMVNGGHYPATNVINGQPSSAVPLPGPLRASASMPAIGLWADSVIGGGK